MLYRLLKTYVRLAIPLYCHSIWVDKKLFLKHKGPLLIASNHPNSFLDAIVFDILFDTPVTSLARGDAFKNKNVFKLLRKLKMLPVYRIREGAENLNTNYQTFDACVALFKQNENVLIFSEGLCVNEWHLRPLKKGTARLAFQSWKEKIPLKVLPAGINYSSFRKYGKAIHIRFGDFITADAFDMLASDGDNYTAFNIQLKAQLQSLVYEIPKGEKKSLQKIFGRNSILKKILLAPFALAGLILHAPIYWAARLLIKVWFNNSDHFDSVMFGFLLITYPFYLGLFTLLAYQIFLSWGFIALITLPLSAFCYTKYDVRFDN